MPPCVQATVWRHENDAIKIADEDAISASGVEIGNLLAQRGIDNVMLLGVHTNMCVISRPFGLRNMVRLGKHVLLVRDLTDAMYNPRMPPRVSHVRGTELMVEYIEQHVCPTITSSDLLGGPAFRFRRPAAAREVKNQMPKPTDIAIREVTCGAEPIDFRTPIKFGGRVMTGFVVVNVTLVAETRDGRRGQGFGSMPMGNIWAWPSPTISPLPTNLRSVPGEGQGVRASDKAMATGQGVPGATALDQQSTINNQQSAASPHPSPLPKGEGTTAERTQAAMIELAQQLVREANHCSGVGHPLEITHELAQSQESAADEITRAAGLAERMPRLAQLVAASPLEAAVHDAYGKALGQNSYNLLGREFVARDLAAYLTPEFAGEYLDQYTLRQPKPRMPLYHLIGALNPLADADVVHPIGDGLPETLSQWIAFNGLTHLKIKLAGDDLPWDVERVLAVERVAAEAQAARGCAAWHYSADFNEKCANVEYVLDFLAKVGERSPAALERLQYIEQPTYRDLRANPENRMHRAARIKPVVIDESLVDLESLLLSRELGYSGVALKACKGHSGALLMAAAAKKYGMFLCVQDLTCPGASFLHSASLAARIPGVAAIEGNGRQYCPAGNRGWADRFPTMFHITDGTLGTAVLDGPGLGF